MIYLPNVYVNRKKEIYNKAIITFDIETTSLFKNPDGTITQSPKDKDNRTVLGTMYHWQMSIDGSIVTGRTWDELLSVFQEIQQQQGIKIIWVHNLSFEFQWLINLFMKTDYPLNVFAKEKHKVMKCDWGTIQFRCTYFLTNMTLAKAAKEFQLEHQKAMGDLDYKKLRGSTTPLTHKEKEYCRLDVIVLAELVKKFLKMYKTLDNIPLTSTGRLRRECQNLMQGQGFDKKRVREAYPNAELFRALRQAFIGGYTHANYLNANQIKENVDSFDIASSYPTVMVSEKFPYKFAKINVASTQPLNSNIAYLYHIVFYGIKTNKSMTYLSKSRSIKCYDVVEDNGRIMTAEWAEFWMTDIDVDIVMKNYDIDHVEVLECWAANKRYLPKKLLEFIFKLYEDKTALKRVAGKEDAYAQSKSFINSMYGMTVTNEICDTVTFENGVFDVEALTEEDIAEQLMKKANSRKTFLLYQWGVWITAYARRNLWTMISQIDEDVDYVDTDSCKFENTEKYAPLFEKYNNEIQEKISKSIRLNELEVNYPPKDKEGIERPMGNFEHEDEYPVPEFKTLGAKKYCYRGKDGELHLTLSGVRKSAAKYINGLDDFKVGKVFNEEQSGRTIAYYIGDQKPFKFIDYFGNEQEAFEQFSICLEPSTYELGMSAEYTNLIGNSTHLSAFGERNGCVTATMVL